MKSINILYFKFLLIGLFFYIQFSAMLACDTPSAEITQTIDCSHNDGNFWLYNNSGGIIGSLLGALFASIIALKSIQRTHEKNKELQDSINTNNRISQEDIYSGNLFAIYQEIEWHINLTKQIKSELKIIKEKTLNDLEFPYKVVHEKYRVEYLDHCRMNVLEFSRFDTDLLALISTYLNLIMQINNNLDFHLIPEVREKYDIDDDSYRKALDEYFEKLDERIEKAELAMTNIQMGVEEVVTSFPENNVILTNLENKSNENAS
jgi:hypothetical protein